MYGLSACVFIRNNFTGGFCLFESMASWLPLVDEFVVLDLGSDDGYTVELLQVIADANPKIRLEHGSWPEEDAKAFADLANHCISLCTNERVLYYQADEIPHQNLLRLARREFENGNFDLSFWRWQPAVNFQLVKWLPHPVHRVGVKGNFNFVGDGMNTDRTWDARLCYDRYDGGWFTRWGNAYGGDGWQNGYCNLPREQWDGIEYPPILPVHEMVLDVGKSGAFRDTIAERARLHAPFWHTEPNVDGVAVDEWERQAAENPDWNKTTTHLDIPHIMKWHVGRSAYHLRQSLFEALKQGNTEDLIG